MKNVGRKIRMHNKDQNGKMKSNDSVANELVNGHSGIKIKCYIN